MYHFSITQCLMLGVLPLRKCIYRFVLSIFTNTSQYYQISLEIVFLPILLKTARPPRGCQRFHGFRSVNEDEVLRTFVANV